MRTSLLLLALVFSFPTISTADFDADLQARNLHDIYKSLPQAQLDNLNKGKTVIIDQPRENSKLPRVYVYKIVKATPTEIAAIMSDYANHKTYFNSGKMTESTIVKRYSPLDTLIAYELEIFSIFIHENYTLRSRLSRYDEARSYRMDRVLVEGETVRAVEGVALAEPIAENTTLVMYYGYVDPGVSISYAEAKVRISEIVDSLTAQVYKEKTKNTKLLEKQLRTMEDLFKQAGE